MSYAGITRTWGDISSNVKRTFGDESGVQLEDGDIQRWINQGQYEIARQNKILKAKGTQNTVALKSTYVLSLGREIQQIESIRYEGKRLVPTEFTTIDTNELDYPANAEGDPKVWYKWGNEITLWPAPKEVGKLEVFFTAATTTHTSFDGTRLLEIPDNYFLPLLDFVLSKAHEMDDNAESQLMSTQQFSERMMSMNDEERAGQSLSYRTVNLVE